MKDKSAPKPRASASKREEQRACDACRRRKRRCDSAQRQSRQCSLCANLKQDCTFQMAAPVRHPPTSYVSALETRTERAEALLRRLFPDINLEEELSRQELDDSESSSPLTSGSSPSQRSEDDRARHTRRPLNPAGEQPDSLSLSTASLDFNMPATSDVSVKQILKDVVGFRLNMCSHAEDDGEDDLAKFDIRLDFPEYKEASEHQQMCHLKLVRPDLDLLVEEMAAMKTHDGYAKITPQRRLQFWKAPSYEFRVERQRWAGLRLDLPPPDLLRLLVNAYFAHVNIFHPILHRGFFNLRLYSGHHISDIFFRALVLAVCACGARFVDDERVLDGPGQTRTAGWKYFDQLEPFRRIQARVDPTVSSMIQLLQLLQLHSLSVSFLTGSGSTEVAAALAGAALRLAQEIGAHRSKSYVPATETTLLHELWKRVFWSLVAHDRYVSCIIDVAPAIHEEGFDIDLPVIADDDCFDLTDSAHNFPLKTQPRPDQPSDMAYFVCYLQMFRIVAFRHRAVNAIKKSTGFASMEQQILANITSALTAWHDSLPPHLRWDPLQTNQTWLSQAALLQCMHDLCLIGLHRFFYPAVDKLHTIRDPSFSPISIEPLTASVQSALRCATVLSRLSTSPGVPVYDWQAIAAATAAVPLFTALWLANWRVCMGGGKYAESTVIYGSCNTRHAAALDVCLDVLKRGERSLVLAGRLYDTLAELVVLDLALEQSRTKMHEAYPEMGKEFAAQSATAMPANPGEYSGRTAPEAIDPYMWQDRSMDAATAFNLVDFTPTPYLQYEALV